MPARLDISRPAAITEFSSSVLLLLLPPSCVSRRRRWRRRAASYRPAADTPDAGAELILIFTKHNNTMHRGRGAGTDGADRELNEYDSYLLILVWQQRYAERSARSQYPTATSNYY